MTWNTTSIYYRTENQDEFDKFDAVAERHQDGDSFSRSQGVREAMKMQRMIWELTEGTEWATLDERALRSAVRQAILEQIRSEQS